MTCLLVVTYLFILFKHIQAVWRGQIVMEGKDEDVSTPEKKPKTKGTDKWEDSEQGENAVKVLSHTSSDVRHRPGAVINGERRSSQHTGDGVVGSTRRTPESS
jgi:hypothetical protein